MFEKFVSRVELSGWVTAETGLRIGAGRSTEVVGPDLPVLRDASGKPFIPGSSFKGVLRSRLESLARAVRNDRRLACHPAENNEWCITYDEITKKKREIAEGVTRGQLRMQDADTQLTEWIKDNTCLLCLTFGSPWLSSKVQVRDLLVDPQRWFDQFQVRNGVAIDRDTETAEDGKLYDYEVVPSGIRFGLRLLIENGEEWQWGMVLCGLRAFENGQIALGGGRSRGLGAVKLEFTERRLFSLNGAMGDERIERLMRIFDGKGFVVIADGTVTTWVGAFKQQLKNRAREA